MSTHFIDKSPGGFFRHYWRAFAWMIFAWVAFGIAAVTANAESSGAVVFAYVVAAIIRSLLAGWRPNLSEASKQEDGCISMVFGVWLLAIFWPFAETWRQARFLWKARGAWKRDEILVNEETEKPVRAA